MNKAELPLTVLLVHNRYQQPGGEDQVFETERDMLREAGHEVVTYEVHNDAVQGMGRFSLLWRTLWNRQTVREVRALIRRHRPSVVHCHNTFPLISPSVYWACRRERVPVVQTLHNYRLTCLNAYLFRDGKVCERCFGRFPWAGLRYRCYRDSLAASSVAALSWFLHFRLLRTYHRAVDRFIVLTEFGRAKMLALGLPPDKLVVKPNVIAMPTEGAELAGESNLQSAICNLQSLPPRVLFVGRLSSEKGVDILVRAWHLASDRLPPGSQLLIVGDGPERPALERLAESLTTTESTEATEGVGCELPPTAHCSPSTVHCSPSPSPSSIVFVGRCPKDEALGRMRSASLFVLPSLCYETFGMALCEAFACGCPAIVMDHGAPASLVEDGVTGFHVRPGDPSALADALVRALSDPARLAAMGRRAAERIASSDSAPERNCARLLYLYQSVLQCG